MIDRFFASRGRAAAAVFSAFAALVGAGAGISACKSDSVSVDQQIQSFCESYMASAGFSCCSAADKASSTFASRYRYGSVNACVQALGFQLSSAGGAQVFDSAAASSCLSFVGGRACGSAPLLADRQAEEEAGCGRVLRGTKGEGQPCATQGDCQAGLFCPSTRETGSAVCAKPAGVNQTCYQQQAESVDHPACDPSANLVCLFSSTTSECPIPPCPTYTCVPRLTVVADTSQAETCTGTDCVSGATCADISTSPSATTHQFVCQDGTGGQPAGKGCRVTEQCASGLYCDSSTGVCTAQKANGASCNPANNTTIFECAGTCDAASGTCVTFCGKG